jgi:cell division protein FtsN
MSSRRKRSKSKDSGLARMVAWTTVLALVFSAGLITGQRMLKRQALPPLVALSSAQAAPASPDQATKPAAGAEEVADKRAEKRADKKADKSAVEFSFYDELSGQPDAPAGQANPKRALKKAAQEFVAEQTAKKVGADAALPARYTLQVGAHTSMERAKVQMDRLAHSGLEPHLIVVEGAEGAKIYKVRVGKFHSMDEARHFQGAIQGRGIDTFVTPL